MSKEFIAFLELPQAPSKNETETLVSIENQLLFWK